MSDSLRLQTQGAFTFIETLYKESALLFKCAERLLADEPEKFQMITKAGYGITTAGSKSLNSPEDWLPRNATVFFAAEEAMENGTVMLNPSTPRIISIRLEFRPKTEDPLIRGFVLTSVSSKKANYKRFHDLMFVFSYSGNRILHEHSGPLCYEDSYCSLKGFVVTEHLFAITGAQDLQQRIITPILAKYRAREI